jgi:hypothetical protein
MKNKNALLLEQFQDQKIVEKGKVETPVVKD